MAQYAFERVQAEYADLWSRMTVTKTAEADRQAQKIVAAKSRYKTVEAKTGVPWFVVGCLHMRESNGSFTTWLHNGDPMVRNGHPAKTVNVPAGRPPNPAVSWEDGAYDALVVCEHLDEIKDWGPEHVAYAAETFNGWGYRSPSRNIPSPYLWGGTSVQKPGKFVRDGVYDPHVIDPQIGVMAMLKQTMAIDSEARFVDKTPAPVAAEDIVNADVPEPESPKAEDTESEVKPLTKSKTMWGGVLQWLGGVGATFAGLFQYLATPWGFGIFTVAVIAISVGLYLVIKGRIDVQAIVKHLSQDDTQIETS